MVEKIQGLSEMRGRRNDGDRSVLNAADGLNFLLKAFDIARVSTHQNGLEAVAMIEMEMLRSHDFDLGVMLNMQKSIDQVWLVMVVNHSKHTDYFSAMSHRGMRGLMPDHRPKSIRTVRELLFADLLVN